MGRKSKPKAKGKGPNKRIKTDQQQLPPKEVGSSSCDEDDEPNTHASSSGATQPNSFIVPTENTLIVGNLSDRVNEIELCNFFCNAGEIEKIRLDTFDDGGCRGTAQVKFATAEAVREACKLSGTELMGKAVTLNFGHERRTICPDISLKKPDHYSDNTVFIRGFDAAYGLNKISGMICDHFESCGLVLRTFMISDNETGASTGSMFLEFGDQLSVSNALLQNGCELLGGFRLHVEKAES